MIGTLAWIPFLFNDVGPLTGGYASSRLIQLGFHPLLARKTIMTIAPFFDAGGGAFGIGNPDLDGAGVAQYSRFWSRSLGRQLARTAGGCLRSAQRGHRFRASRLSRGSWWHRLQHPGRTLERFIELNGSVCHAHHAAAARSRWFVAVSAGPATPGCFGDRSGLPGRLRQSSRRISEDLARCLSEKCGIFVDIVVPKLTGRSG